MSANNRHQNPPALAIRDFIFWPMGDHVKMLMNVKMEMDIVNSFVSTHLGPISVLVKLALDWKRIGKDVDGLMIISNS